jgi:hypothetical protein
VFDSPFVVPVVLFLSIAAVLILRGPLGRALADRLARRGAGRAEPADGLTGELDDLRRRMGELEERLDFTERLLARQARVAERLPPER